VERQKENKSKGNETKNEYVRTKKIWERKREGR
jgi:hypothetical protein